MLVGPDWQGGDLARIRKVEIWSFRAIQHLSWYPSEGVNCLVGPGDSGKSTILDAIDLCLGARRSLHVSDTDFFNLDVNQRLAIQVTLGALPDSLSNIETYGHYFHAYNPLTGAIEDEPQKGFETVMVLSLTVEKDLEPVWWLKPVSSHQEAQPRNISWSDRKAIAPARLGQFLNSQFSWAQGSVLSRLTDERLSLSGELANIERQARAALGQEAIQQFSAPLATVTNIANSLGISVGTTAKAMLDTEITSRGSGAISLHNEIGVPLRNLGTGSSRLLVAGMQREAALAASASIVLVDEVEYGLEPHRLIRLLRALGAKDTPEPLQVFMTTHSPVVLRELSGKQLHVVRKSGNPHVVHGVGLGDDIQGTIRKDPEAFLAGTVIVCEGASEVGFIRGLDLYFSDQGFASIYAAGVALVDSGGGDPARALARGMAFRRLGYKCMVFVDSDKPAPADKVKEFTDAGGQFFSWRAGRALEDELFLSLADKGVDALLLQAQSLNGRDLVDEHIKSQTGGQRSLADVETESLAQDYLPATRAMLGLTSRSKRSSWFKTVTRMEDVARTIVGPGLETSEAGFKDSVYAIFRWAHNGG